MGPYPPVRNRPPCPRLITRLSVYPGMAVKTGVRGIW